MAIIVVRLFDLQIIKSADYSENFTQKTKRVITTQAARGNIYDRNGTLLAYNEIAYSVTITDEIPSSSTRGATLNGIIYKAIQLIEKNGDSITCDFNIELSEDGTTFVFKEDPPIRQITFLINVFNETSDEISADGYDQYSAEQVMEYIYDKFGINDEYTETEYTKEEALKIAAVRYTISLTSYKKYVSTVIADDVSEQTKAAILECTDDLTGIDIEENYKRVYTDSEYFAHLLGYVGEISEDELEELNLDNDAGIEYEIGDYVGKTGIEQSFDSYLQGTKGTETVFVDSTGQILQVINESQSETGNDLYLTIDSNLQKVAYNILEKKLASCLINKIVTYDVESAEKQTYVYIPIKDVYYQILTNICDPSLFSDEDASDREKAIYNIYSNEETDIMNEILSMLQDPAAENLEDLDDEYNDYMYIIYNMLVDDGIINKNSLDTDSDAYTRLSEGTISLREFIQAAIAENWIDVIEIDSSQKYSDSAEVYQSIVEYIQKELPEYNDFIEKIYYYLVYRGSITPYDTCMLLYDQGRIEIDDEYYKLASAEIDTYTYVITEIENLVLTPAMIALDPCSGSLCITDADTGDVLALVSYPSYDNNMLSGHVDSDYWYELTRNDSQPLFNYSTMAITPPGSTFKMATAVAALSEGYIDPDTMIFDSVKFEEISPSPSCSGSHGWENVSSALRDSCNYFFFTLGYEMGLDENGEYQSVDALDILDDYASRLGLGTTSGVEISETSPRLSTTDSVRSAIGQGTNGYTTTQMTRYVNCIANSGKNYQLTLVDKVVDNNGSVIYSKDPIITNTVELSVENWDAIHYGMNLVTTTGTASSFFTDLDTSLAGKTGTAEENIYRSNHATFVGYAPYESPEISFACMIRNCDSTSYPGGVMSEILQYYFGEITIDDVFNSPVENNIEGFHSD